MAEIREPGFRMTVYETRVAESSGHDELQEKEDRKDGDRPLNAYTVLQGRPDFTSAIRDARRDCVGGSLAVVSCGPPRMADACRGAVVEVLGDEGAGRPGVEFFNEAMAW